MSLRIHPVFTEITNECTIWRWAANAGARLLIEVRDCPVMRWGVCALVLALFPQVPVQLHAVQGWATSSAMPLPQSNHDLLHSPDSAGPDLHLLLTASWQLYLTVHLWEGHPSINVSHMFRC